MRSESAGEKCFVDARESYWRSISVTGNTFNRCGALSDLNQDNQDWDIKPPQDTKVRREKPVLIVLRRSAAVGLSLL